MPSSTFVPELATSHTRTSDTWARHEVVSTNADTESDLDAQLVRLLLLASRVQVVDSPPEFFVTMDSTRTPDADEASRSRIGTWIRTEGGETDIRISSVGTIRRVRRPRLRIVEGSPGRVTL